MNSLLKQKFILFFHLIIFASLMEISMYILIYDKLIPDFFMLEVARIVIFASLIFIFKKNKYSFIYSIIIFTLFSTLYILNITFDYASGDIFTFAYLKVLKEAMGVASSSFISIIYLTFLAAFVIAYFLSIIPILIYYKNKNDYKKKYYPISLVYTFFIIAIGIITKNACYKDIEKNYNNDLLYNNMTGEEIVNDSAISLKKGSLKKFGLLNHFIAEIDGIFFDTEKSYKEKIDNYLKEGEESKDNYYTGSLKDMNILTIMVESMPSYVINKDLTPNLYKIYKEGLYFNNNLCKNKTNYSEILGMVGSQNYPIELEKGFDNPNSLANILKNKGYDTRYFHDNDGTFYDRIRYIKEIGFDKSYFHKDFFDTKIEFKGNMPFDTDFVNKTADLMISGDKFYTFWTTIATHGPYNESMESISKYENYVGLDGITYKEKLAKAYTTGSFKLGIDPENYFVRRYASWDFKSDYELDMVRRQLIHLEYEMMNFDESLGIILKKLEDKNKLDNTLIILYGDHDAYYTSNGLKPLKYYVYGAYDKKTGELEEYPNQYETFMAFYNPKLNSLYQTKENKNTVDYVTSPGIIVPTVLDLLGIKYNENKYLNKSIFNSDELTNLMYSYEIETVFSDKIMAYYGDYFKYQDKNINDEYINNFKKSMNNILYKNRYLSLMYKYHYYGSGE